MNYNLHHDLEYSSTIVQCSKTGNDTSYPSPSYTDETCIVIRGRQEVMFYDENISILSHRELNPDDGVYGVHVPVNIWHTLNLESGTVIFEVKDGAYFPIKLENTLI